MKKFDNLQAAIHIRQHIFLYTMLFLFKFSLIIVASFVIHTFPMGYRIFNVLILLLYCRFVNIFI